MIRKIKLLRNIGTFDSDNAAASVDFKRLVLVYGENGRGKTTLTAALRSLSTGDGLPVAERQRFGSQHAPHIILECEGLPNNVIFENDVWNRTLPNLRLFDDVFVDENVYSGLDVDSQHRQNLHELILGEQGVKLNRRLQVLVSRRNQHNSDLEQKSKSIPEQTRRGLSVDEFCDLPKLTDVDAKIEKLERALTAARDQDALKTSPTFKTINLPQFDNEEIGQVLKANLADLDRTAESQVMAHVETLGNGGESWIAAGMNHLAHRDDDVCPFCGQGITGLDLLAHYRAYFSEAYSQLKQDIADMTSGLQRDHAEGAQVNFERAVGDIRGTERYWSKYCDIEPIDVDTKAIIQSWTLARRHATQLLKSKQTAPLESSELDAEALTALMKYDAYRKEIYCLNSKLIAYNKEIEELQEQAEQADVDAIVRNLNKLRAIQTRYSEEVDHLCQEYLKEKRAKALTETKIVEARNALKEYRDNVFPKLQSGVNRYLGRFNAGFRIGNLAPVNIGGGSGSTCAYNVVINETTVAVKSDKVVPGVASFRNTMSSGDRNTLALALFFSSLDQDPNLSNTIVILDDPMSSLDEHRSLTTVQEVRKLAERAGQAIVLSHNRRFLCEVWYGEHGDERVALEIAQDGDGSTILLWDVSQDAITEHDQRHELLKDFADTGSQPNREVAQAIRLYLEGYLRVACPGSFHPGSTLGPFVNTCEQKLGGVDEVLNQATLEVLKDLNEYSTRFHHDTNPSWQSETINVTELRGFVKRTLAFVGPPQQ